MSPTSSETIYLTLKNASEDESSVQKVYLFLYILKSKRRGEKIEQIPRARKYQALS